MGPAGVWLIGRVLLPGGVPVIPRRRARSLPGRYTPPLGDGLPPAIRIPTIILPAGSLPANWSQRIAQDMRLTLEFVLLALEVQ